MARTPVEPVLIDEKKDNERRGVTDRKYLTCEKSGDVFEVRDGLACHQPKETCKFRFNCPIHQIGRND